MHWCSAELLVWSLLILQYSTCLWDFEKINNNMLIIVLLSLRCSRLERNPKQMEFFLSPLEFEIIIRGFSSLYNCFCLIPRNTDTLHFVSRKLLGCGGAVEHRLNL